jgi:hypothetical protein
MKNPHKIFLLLTALLIVTFTAGCEARSKSNSASYPNPQPAYPNSGCAGQVCPEAEATVTIPGRLTVVQNGHTVYTLFDDQGTSWELIIDESLLQSVGGAQALKDKRITVSGTWTSDTPAKIRVTFLEVK